LFGSGLGQSGTTSNSVGARTAVESGEAQVKINRLKSQPENLLIECL
jgi:hypothetical protein